MKALIINGTLKRGDAVSNTHLLAEAVADELSQQGVEVEQVRAVNHAILPGVTDNEGKGDEWPAIYEKVKAADILVIATPTWLGQPSSVTQRVLERMDAMISATDDSGRPLAYNKVGGVVVTGNEDGAHHIIAIVAQALIDIGYTIPGQAWTYWNMGPGPGPSYSETDHKHDWSEKTGRQAARNMVAVATALQANPLPPMK